MRSGFCRGGTLVLCGRELRRTEGHREEVRLLSIFGVDGRERHRLWHHDRSAWDFERRRYTERHAYFPDQGRGWTIDPRGDVYVARERDRYAIHVFSPAGMLKRVIEREYAPRRRSAEERRNFADGLTMAIGGEVVKLDAEVLETEPCLRELRVDSEGRLWVWHARSYEDQPDGIFATCDLFAPNGSYLAELQLAVEGDPRRDRLVPLADGRFALLRGISDAMDAMWGAGGEDPTGMEIVPLEVVILRTSMTRL